MLEDIRESSQGFTAKIILGFIILTFAVAGIGSYTNTTDTSIADVNGEKISQDEFSKAYGSQRERMSKQFGDMFETLSADASYMSNFRQGIVDNLINQKLVDQNTQALAIRVSDERIKDTIRNMPEFQVDGVFDNNRYLVMINQASFFQPSAFRDYLRVEMTRRQLTQAVIMTEFNLPYQADIYTALQNQQRDIRFATISASQFKADIKITDDEIKEYYSANQVMFENQEKVKVDYITLDVKDIAKNISLTDADVETYYQENIGRYTSEEQRRVSHILTEFGDDQAKAEALAQDLLNRINSGEDFATLAKENSADSFSAENGGDLDWIETGVFGDEFDKAAFALAGVGSISELIKTDSGYHIIKLTDFKAKKVKSLIDVREELVAQAKNEKAQDKYFELQQEVARLSFEFPDSLDDAAESINANVITSDWLTRGTNTEIFNGKAIEAAFSDIVLLEQLNSDVVEVNDNLAIVVRLNEYQEANVKPLTQVTAKIRDILVAQKSSEQAQTVADELLAALKSGTDITEKLTQVGATMEVKSEITRTGSDLDASLVREAFKLPHPNKDAISATTVNLSNGDLAVLEVQVVKNGDTKQMPQLSQQLTQQLSQATYMSYVESLKADATIVRREVAAPTSQY